MVIVGSSIYGVCPRRIYQPLKYGVSKTIKFNYPLVYLLNVSRKDQYFNFASIEAIESAMVLHFFYYYCVINTNMPSLLRLAQQIQHLASTFLNNTTHVPDIRENA